MWDGWRQSHLMRLTTLKLDQGLSVIRERIFVWSRHMIKYKTNTCENVDFLNFISHYKIYLSNASRDQTQLTNLLGANVPSFLIFIACESHFNSEAGFQLRPCTWWQRAICLLSSYYPKQMAPSQIAHKSQFPCARGSNYEVLICFKIGSVVAS